MSESPTPEDSAGPMQEMLTAIQVGEYFQVKASTVKKWCKNGEFPDAIFIPGPTGWRIPQSDVKAYAIRMRNNRPEWSRRK